MKLEQQVTNLELSKRLKELKVPQVSHFFHYAVYDKKIGDIQTYRYKVAPWNASGNNEYSAFTVAELGEMLPEECATYKYEEPGYKKWMAKLYVKGDWSKYINLIPAETEANARAKMIIYLLENKLIANPL